MRALCFGLLWMACSAFALPPELGALLTIGQISQHGCPRLKTGPIQSSLSDNHLQLDVPSLTLDLHCSASRIRTTSTEPNHQVISNQEDRFRTLPSLVANWLKLLPQLDLNIQRLIVQTTQGPLEGRMHIQYNAGHVLLMLELAHKTLHLQGQLDNQGWDFAGPLPLEWIPYFLPAIKTQGKLTFASTGRWQPLTGHWQLIGQGSIQAMPYSGEFNLRTRGNIQPQGVTLKQGSSLALKNIQGIGVKSIQFSTRAEGLIQPELITLPIEVAGRFTDASTRLPRFTFGLDLTFAPQQGTLHTDLILPPNKPLSFTLHLKPTLTFRAKPQQVELASLLRWAMDQGGNTLSDLNITQGTLTLFASGNRKTLNIEGSMPKLDAQLKAMQLTEGALSFKGQLSLSKLQWHPSSQLQFTAKSLDVGVPLQALTLKLKGGKIPHINTLSLNLLGGNLIANAIPLQFPIQGKLILQRITLSELFTLFNVSGLSGEGELNGDLPFRWDKAFTITNGTITNVAPGKIRYVGQQDLEQLNSQNPSLAMLMRILRELDYQELNANMSMFAGGQTQIKVTIRGNSPSLGGNRPVIFNYTHDENLLNLLKSLRFTSDLEAMLEKSLDQKEHP